MIAKMGSMTRRGSVLYCDAVLHGKYTEDTRNVPPDEDRTGRMPRRYVLRIVVTLRYIVRNAFERYRIRPENYRTIIANCHSICTFCFLSHNRIKKNMATISKKIRYFAVGKPLSISNPRP